MATVTRSRRNGKPANAFTTISRVNTQPTKLNRLWNLQLCSINNNKMCHVAKIKIIVACLMFYQTGTRKTHYILYTRGPIFFFFCSEH